MIGTRSYSRSAARGPLIPQLPARAATLLGGQVVRDVNGVISTTITPESLVPLPAGAATNIFYWDVGRPNDTGDGLTMATAKGFLYSAITLGNASGQPYSICMKGGTAAGRGRNHHNGTSVVVPTQACRFYSDNGQDVTLFAGTNGTWTVQSGTTYQRTDPTGVAEVVYLDVNDAFGAPVALVNRGSLANVNAAASGWFASGSLLYVKRADGAAVTNANIACLFNASAGGIKNSTSGNTWFENIRTVGGTDGGFKLLGNLTGRVLLKNTSSYWTTNSAGDTDGVQSTGIQLVVASNHKSAYNDKDGLNYHTDGAGSVPQAVCFDCAAWENGTFVTNTSCNGPTIHDGGLLVSFRSACHHNHGASYSHIGSSTMAVHVGDSALNDYGDQDRGGSQAASTGFMPLTGCDMYTYGITGATSTAGGGTITPMSAS